jgi:hypothetical protein
MKAFEVDSEGSELALVLPDALPVLFDGQPVALLLYVEAFCNEVGYLAIQTLALLSESLPLIFLLNVHASRIRHWLI